MKKALKIMNDNFIGQQKAKEDPSKDKTDSKGSASKLNVKDLLKEYEEARSASDDKLQKVRDMEVFVLDNSLRESTVAQLRGHTLEDKTKIYQEVKRCGFNHIIVASYGHNTQIDDIWVKDLIRQGEDPSGLYAFSEITNDVKEKVPNTTDIPVGLRKMKDAGLYNVILEMDLSDVVYDFQKLSMKHMLQLVKKWIVWCHEHLHQHAKVFVNFRDMGETMRTWPIRILEATEFFARLPENLRPFGIMYEDVSGNFMPEEVGNWAKSIRKIMDAYGWDARLLAHIHERYGFSDASQLHSLMSGADGVWASVCSEGAALGHASSSVTLMNLVRLGNKRVSEMYRCQYLRKAAINVTLITTGDEPHPKQPIYGARALDFVFKLAEAEFDLAGFFEEEAPTRISTLTQDEKIVEALVKKFGKNPNFTLATAKRMKAVMIEDLSQNKKEEYMSAAGLAVLFDKAGGKLTEEMRDIIVQVKEQNPHTEALITQVRYIWDRWDQREEESNDEMLTFDSFYDGFMAPYFGCYRCSDTQKALQAIDMDDNGQVDWNEFLVYLKWALNQNPNMRDAAELLEYTFRKGIIPAMRDEIIK